MEIPKKTRKTPPPRRPKLVHGPYGKNLPKYNLLAGSLRKARAQIAAGAERERKLEARIACSVAETTGPDENGMAYVKLDADAGVASTIEAIAGVCNLDLDEDGRLIGIELIGVDLAGIE